MWQAIVIQININLTLALALAHTKKNICAAMAKMYVQMKSHKFVKRLPFICQSNKRCMVTHIIFIHTYDVRIL